jgi:hypothetical protein
VKPAHTLPARARAEGPRCRRSRQRRAEAPPGREDRDAARANLAGRTFALWGSRSTIPTTCAKRSRGIIAALAARGAKIVAWDRLQSEAKRALASVPSLSFAASPMQRSRAPTRSSSSPNGRIQSRISARSATRSRSRSCSTDAICTIPPPCAAGLEHFAIGRR